MASLIHITSANSKLRIIVPAYYPAGFDVDDYGADTMYDIQAVTNKETRMSADGKFHAGFTYASVPLTITLQPTSKAGELLDEMVSAERTAATVFQVNATLIVPALSRKYTFTNGVIISSTPVAPGRRTIQERPFAFEFENVVSSPI